MINLHYKAAIFDMDGLLVDSEPLWMLAEKEVFSTVGLILSDAMCYQTRGLRLSEVVEYWYQRFPLSGSIHSTSQALELNVSEKIEKRATALSGVYQILNLLQQHEFAIGLASSSPLSIIHRVIDKLKIHHYFQAVLSATNLANGKPHPQVYIQTALNLGVAPQQCIAFEDSVTGLIACKAAKMFSFAVPEPSQFNDPRFSIADKKLASLNDFHIELLKP